MLAEGECSSRADLARKLGVTQVLNLLKFTPEVTAAIAALGDPLPRPIISERMLRPLLRLPPEEQRCALQGLADFPVVPSALQQRRPQGSRRATISPPSRRVPGAKQ